jgi:hypothetical protein
MSFWSEASPVVKAVIVLGAVGVVVAVLAMAGIGPVAAAGGEDTTNVRGLSAGQ